MADYTAKRVDELEGFYKGLFLKARAELGVQSFGMSVVEFAPGSDAHPDHDHSSAGQEEDFVILRAGEMNVDGETVSLDPEMIVRVGPEAKRKITPGPEGMRLSLGGVPGKAYEAPDYTELGAPDPLG